MYSGTNTIKKKSCEEICRSKISTGIKNLSEIKSYCLRFKASAVIGFMFEII